MGDGAIGDSEPEPVVLGGVTLRIGALVEPVAIGGALLLAVLLPLLFQPAIRTNAIKASTARPAIQPQVPLEPSSRRNTGSLNSGSL